MSIKKVTLSSLILLSLTACSGGGGSGSNSNNTEPQNQPTIQQPNSNNSAAQTLPTAQQPSTQNNSSDAKKAEADRIAKEKAEAERLKKEEIDNELVNFLKGNEASQYYLGLTKTTDKLIYNQKYSITTMPKNDSYIYPNQITTKGLETANRYIPNEGKATYIGKAYGAFNQNGELSYSVDFGKRVGEGKITGVERFKDNIILEKGTIQDNRIVSSTRTGSQAVGANTNSEFNRYEIKFFGPKAEEIGGKATVGDYNFGLVGTRGEITK